MTTTQKPIIRLHIDDKEIIQLLGHYDARMLKGRMITLLDVICDCTATQEAEIFVRSHDSAGLVLAMMN